MRKILAMAVCVALLATMAITGTVAYLTSSDGAVNVMTTGSVFIKQYEQERVMEDGQYVKDGDNIKLTTYTNGQQIVPAVYDGQNRTDVTVNGYTFKMRTEDKNATNSVQNYVDKIVTVENTGTANAYVRTIIAIPEALDVETKTKGIDTNILSNPSNQWLHWNYLSDSDTEGGNGWIWGKSAENEWPGSDYSKDIKDWYFVNNVTIKVDGKEGVYDLYVVTNKNVIEPGEKTAPNLVGFYIDKDVDNEMDANGNIYYTYDEKSLGDISDLNILVMTQAVQADGFADAWTALNNVFGEITVDNYPWKGEDVGAPEFELETGAPDGAAKVMNLKNDVTVTNKAFYQDKTATEAYTINGNGKTINMVVTKNANLEDAVNNIFSSGNGAKVTLNNLNITGTLQAVKLGHYNGKTYDKFESEMNNVNIINAKLLATENSGMCPALMIYGTATLNNCNVYGSTISEWETDAANQKLYDVAITNYTDVTINGGKIGSLYAWNQAGITLKNAEVEKITVAGRMFTQNPDKYCIKIEAGTKVGTLDLSNIGVEYRSEQVHITIADGAEVDSIVANGVTYSSIADFMASGTTGNS